MPTLVSSCAQAGEEAVRPQSREIFETEVVEKRPPSFDPTSDLADLARRVCSGPAQQSCMGRPEARGGVEKHNTRPAALPMRYRKLGWPRESRRCKQRGTCPELKL